MALKKDSFGLENLSGSTSEKMLNNLGNLDTQGTSVEENNNHESSSSEEEEESDLRSSFGKNMEKILKLQKQAEKQQKKIKPKSHILETISPSQLNGKTKQLMARFDKSSEEKAKERQHIANEIKKTEENYVTKLTLFVEKFINPLYEASLVTGDVLNLFGNLEKIKDYHVHFLKELSEKMENWDDQQLIGDLFKKKTNFLVTYSNYVNGFDSNLRQIKTAQVENQPFSTFVQKFQKEHKTDLDSLLLEPIQRIPRYELLLKQMYKNTGEGHPDFVNLASAVEKLEKISLYINEEKRKSENHEQMESLKHQIIVPAKIIDLKDFEKKIFVKKDLLIARSRSLTNHKLPEQVATRLYVLFIDCLFVCKEKKNTEKYKVEHIIELDELSTERDVEMIKLRMLFSYVTTGKKDKQKLQTVVFAERQPQYAEWNSVIRNTIKLLHTPRSDLEGLQKMEKIHESISEGVLDMTFTKARDAKSRGKIPTFDYPKEAKAQSHQPEETQNEIETKQEK